ncbi:hypothetical protein [Pannonibacter phragmitetus]|uniref:hypothetical protein n=1 Tax=Pannonibacter phragmitetus TaxID=121719 RepID=UPI00128F5CA8|nr:hypothetical protein [Pannonibacter phragmitetus]
MSDGKILVTFQLAAAAHMPVCQKQNMAAVPFRQAMVGEDQHSDEVRERAGTINKGKAYFPRRTGMHLVKERANLLAGLINVSGGFGPHRGGQVSVSDVAEQMVPNCGGNQLVTHGIGLRWGSFQRPPEFFLKQHSGLAQIMEKSGNGHGGSP